MCSSVVESKQMNLNTLPQNRGIQLIAMLVDAGNASTVELRQRISNVRLAPLGTAIAKKCECIHFEMDGTPYLGELRGRNRDLVVGVNPDSETNRSIALRVYLDQGATPL